MTEIKNLKIGFIGFGNMGSAIAEGLIQSGKIREEQIYACSGSFEKCKIRCQELGKLQARRNSFEVAEEAELLFLCVKPKMVPSVLSELGDRLSGKKIVSIVWGYDFEKLKALLPEDTGLLCTCPNIPVSVGKGIFVVEKKHNLSDEDFSLLAEILSAVASLVMVDGSQMNIAGILSACAPAFADVFIEALGDAGVMYGLPRDTAYALASGMLEGTAALQQASGAHPGAMKDAVCSPGGATIKGIARLEEKSFRASVISAVKAIQGD